MLIVCNLPVEQKVHNQLNYNGNLYLYDFIVSHFYIYSSPGAFVYIALLSFSCNTSNKSLIWWILVGTWRGAPGVFSLPRIDVPVAEEHFHHPTPARSN